ncbi:(2Fe-2S) ferredoxin domain-containing protein [Tissierella creatinini]|nr:(2Fe-2S) ferredoxin domain-containing protein [Tissierella creatinini]TJX64632.1 (2Fe-2S) ferredoxin domain-containing protein [Soehngenia saccharolytica]
MRVKICMGSNCTLLGAMSLLDQIEGLKEVFDEDNERYNDEELEIEAVSCMNYCKKTDATIAPVVAIDDEVIFNATGQIVMEKIMGKKKK